MKRIAIRLAILLPLLAALYFALPTIYKTLGISAVRSADSPIPSIRITPPAEPANELAADQAAPQRLDGNCRARKHRAAPKAKAEIYTWVDANGRTHFGDNGKSRNAKVVDIKQDAASQFTLKVNDSGAVMPLDFRNQLEVRIRKSYTVLAQLLPAESIRASKVDLWVFASNDSYEIFKQKYAPGLSAASTGFHSSKENIAAVWHKNDKQLMRTSIHEAAHVNNWAMLGITPTWLNEGLAEYLERMKVYGQAAEIEPNKGWLRTLNKTPLTLSAVVRSSHKDWGGDNRNALYAHSWAFVYFLLSDGATRDLLKSYLAAVAAQPCVANDFINYSDANFAGGFTQLNRNFSGWRPEKATAHVY